MPVTAPETTAINPPADAPSVPADHQGNSLLRLSYDFRLFPPRPDEDPLVTARRPITNNGANNAQEARKHQTAEALLARVPTLLVYQFPYDQIATFERISPEQARDKYRHLELNSRDGGNGIVIALRDEEATVSFPFWHESGKAEQAFQEAWICLETICGQTGYMVYDPQLERMVNVGCDVAAVLESYIGVVNRLREGHSNARPVQMRPPCDVTIRELARPQGAGVVLLAVDNSGAVFGFAEISVDSMAVTGSPARTVAAVTGWYIQPASRCREIGDRLLQSARDWTTAHRLGDLTNRLDSQAVTATPNTRLPEISPAAATANS